MHNTDVCVIVCNVHPHLFYTRTPQIPGAFAVAGLNLMHGTVYHTWSLTARHRVLFGNILKTYFHCHSRAQEASLLTVVADKLHPTMY